MNGLLCLAAAAAFLVAPNLAIDCSNNRCTTRGATHTMCMYPNPKPSPVCEITFSSVLSEAERRSIIIEHNKVRQFVAAGKEKQGNPGPQPAASNMKNVSWDDELAEIAQRWANQCSVGNDDCRDVARFAVGQNTAIIFSKIDMYTTTPLMVMEFWYNQVKNMDRAQVKKLTSVENVGQYTQMVWAATEKIGCGKVLHKAAGWYNFYMVCNYGPTGNVLGQNVYLAQY